MIYKDLQNLDHVQQANLRAEEVTKSVSPCAYTEGDLTIEIVSIKKIEKGVEILAKAWKNEKPIGFMDGSVETERFRMFNPPILVDDENGPIQLVSNNEEGKVYRLREDPLEATKKHLANTIRIVGKENANVTPGKIGSTTSTFNPSVAGVTARGGVNQTLANIRAGAGNFNNYVSTNLQAFLLQASSTSNQYQEMDRSILVFDTSSIPDSDPISSAKVTVYPTTLSNTLLDGTNANSSMYVVSSNPASTSTLTNADYGTLGSTSYGNSVVFNSLSLSTLTDINLNATGISAISKTGFTKFGIIGGNDLNNSATGITWGSSKIINIIIQMHGGAPNDPVLTVVHGNTNTGNFFMLFN